MLQNCQCRRASVNLHIAVNRESVRAAGRRHCTTTTESHTQTQTTHTHVGLSESPRDVTSLRRCLHGNRRRPSHNLAHTTRGVQCDELTRHRTSIMHTLQSHATKRDFSVDFTASGQKAQPCALGVCK